MDKELKILTDNYKLDQLYQNNLFSIKSICELLGVWDNYTPEQKFQLENFTKRDSDINKHFDFKGYYNNNYTYGEVIRSGVEVIIEKINKYKKPNEKDIFIDIGSGSGKLVMHLSIKSDIKTLVGVEIVPQRNRYSKWIKEKILADKSIFFIEKDIRDFDISIASIIFMNNICFDSELNDYIYNKAREGCHLISAVPIEKCKILKEEFQVDASWSKLNLFYYIK